MQGKENNIFRETAEEDSIEQEIIEMLVYSNKRICLGHFFQFPGIESEI